MSEVNEELIKFATDQLYTKLQAFRKERTPENLLAVVRAAKEVELQAFRPILLKHYRAVQVVNNKFIPPEGVTNEENIPADTHSDGKTNSVSSSNGG